MQKTTGAGFAFSVPYGYGTVRMGGHSRFVDCADDHSTRGDCSNLQVCVIKGSLHVQLVGLPKPYIVELELDDMLPGLLDGRCNVAVGHTPDLEKALLLVPDRFAVKVGKRVLSTEPLSIVTRDDDPEWSDLVNWVLLSLMYADEHGITTQSLADYFSSTTSFGRRFEHMFFDAIGSVGSFLEIRSRYSHGEHNHTPRDALHFINQHELSGALLSPDFGNADRTGPDPASDGYITNILYRGYFICGITGQRPGFAVLNPNTGGWSGLDVDFCRAVAASLFHGNPDYYMEIVHFASDSPHDDAFEALADGRVDVLAGMRMSFARDVFQPTCRQGFSFSLPYYYDNER
jgi:ABC-type amino acid transport substrate-binding protein